MCCLGYDAMDRGIDPRDMISYASTTRDYYPASPRHLMNLLDKDYDAMLKADPVNELMIANDNKRIPDDASRVRMLNAICKNHSLSFRFALKEEG